MPADAFIDRIVVDALAARHVVIGYDFRFGKGRTGDPETMRRAGDAQGFGVTVVAQVGEAGEVFSSNAIRAELAQGDVAGAAQMLGHWWQISGRVIGGFKRGAGLGFPTANLALAPGTALAHGIYAVRVYVDSQVYAAAAYLGTRPTFDDGAPMLEVFLFEFDGDLYGREIAVEFIDFVRADAKFGSVEALKEQIASDCSRARSILETAGPLPKV
jgi:riboflavin kinase/FMN adenylyltransferase